MAHHGRVYARWVKVIDEWRESGLSGAEFCRRHELRAKSFYKWRQRLEEEGAAEGSSEFVPVSFSDSRLCPGCGVRVVIGDRIHLELSSGFDAEVLRRAVQALGGPC